MKVFIGGCSFWQPVQADSQPKSSGLVLGRRTLGAILHSSNELGELSQWLCHDDSTISIVVVIIIIFKSFINSFCAVYYVSHFSTKYTCIHCVTYLHPVLRLDLVH